MKPVICGILAMISMAAGAAAAEARPNIVFILADDHGVGAVGCYGGILGKTPRIDLLAAQGMRFENCFVTSSLCSPSRAAIVTGKYAHLNGQRTIGPRFDGAQATIAKLLHRNGYATALIGKWHLGSDPTGYDYWNIIPNQGRYEDPELIQNGTKRVVQGYLTDLITADAIRWLEKRPRDKPFFLMVHHKSPHGPMIPAPRHRDLYQELTLPEPETLLDDYQGRAPALVKALHASKLTICEWEQFRRTIQSLPKDPAAANHAMYQIFFKGYMRLIASLDENVGRLLDYLDRAGLADNTIVVYTSDNGFFCGEHGFYNKMWMYEQSLRVPLLVRWPKHIQPGSLNRQMVMNLDFAPTFADLAGGGVPDEMQGRSLRPLLEGRSSGDWRQEVYYHYYNQFDIPGQFGIRTPTRKLVCYPGLVGRQPFWEMFDLQADPQEMRNLAAVPVQQGTVAALKERLRALAKRYQDAEIVKILDLLGLSPPQPSKCQQTK